MVLLLGVSGLWWRLLEEGWTREVLETLIATQLHQRVTPVLTTFDRAVPEAEAEKLRQIIKDPYVLDFLANGVMHERDLRKALTDNLSKAVTQAIREAGELAAA